MNPEPLPKSTPSMSREAIFTKIRAALEPISDKAEHPGFNDAAVISAVRTAGSPVDAFVRNLTAVNGRVMQSAAEIIDFFRQQGHTTGYCDPSLMDALGQALAAAGFEVRTTYERENYDRYDFGITRASGGIAETGSIILDDTLTSDRLAALSPWVHIAVLSRSGIHPDVPSAIARLGPSRNVIWVTGPSKTADVEGILIEGVHGPGEQIAYLVD